MFYTYLWLREDGTPYYVGKGSGKRAYRKGSPSREYVLTQEFPSEDDALSAEQFLIGYYGRKDLGSGNLINLTDGGDKPPVNTAPNKTSFKKGHNNPRKGTGKTEEQRRLSHNKINENYRRKLGILPLGEGLSKTAFKKGHKHSLEVIEKLRTAAKLQKRKPLSEETKKKIREAALKRSRHTNVHNN